MRGQTGRGKKMNERPVAVGIDVGGTKIRAGYVAEDGEVLRTEQYPMDRSSQAAALHSIYRAADDFLQTPWDGTAPCGIGVGLVGQVDPGRGVWVQAINIPIREPVALAAELTRRYGLPAAMDNDVQASTHAERLYGAGKEFEHFIYINVGTGIAMGIVADGVLVRGAANYAGEFGHMSVDPHGDVCICGRRGCLEPIASGGGMVERAGAHLASYPHSSLHAYADRLQSQAIFEEARRGDPLAARLAQNAMEALGSAVTNAVNLLNPQAVIVGGGVFRDMSLIEELNDYIRRFSLPAAAQSLVRIETSELDIHMVGLLGAASLVWRS
ncbi:MULTISPECIES: ROK family protein [unclassified Paenibacillus]|uniref:ROK family protein n=1 Tax=unclassified Paenibacillus TaxID=185978 RepID=UPI001C0FDD5E|nr:MULTISPECIES: ROK family protein [unclassified Paenibacillus]MBU5442539.1 ROK family protein [Paenibacillus sp. MSJ-34]CAH0120622.1 Glucokinase [Paenibacillus sp. CECT 9249]